MTSSEAGKLAVVLAIFASFAHVVDDTWSLAFLCWSPLAVLG